MWCWVGICMMVALFGGLFGVVIRIMWEDIGWRAIFIVSVVAAFAGYIVLASRLIGTCN